MCHWLPKSVTMLPRTSLVIYETSWKGRQYNESQARQALDPSNDFDSLVGGCTIKDVGHEAYMIEGSKNKPVNRRLTEVDPVKSEDPLGREMSEDTSHIDHSGFLEGSDRQV